MPLPTPELIVQPPNGRTLVNIDTIFRTEAAPFRRTVTLLGHRVTFDIKAQEFRWTLGDGHTMTTTEPGVAYAEQTPRSQYVAYRYTTAGKVHLGLTTVWGADWSLDGGPFQPVPGTVQMDAPTQPLEILEARPQLVSYH
ncbi:hypothetical protein [Nocardioides acrostichi]|uniref:PKD domain-containing protein n=1 Tax=Nocardioides acrostichi TaxID=2784339 RepID=A0A930Y805_9ACTN|nr:hypothetical protein [Nocardioides acrostichi]MBF4162546.1 hypothetical protein [Nocardioides acrostichi]